MAALITTLNANQGINQASQPQRGFHIRRRRETHLEGPAIYSMMLCRWCFLEIRIAVHQLTSVHNNLNIHPVEL